MSDHAIRAAHAREVAAKLEEIAASKSGDDRDRTLKAAALHRDSAVAYESAAKR